MPTDDSRLNRRSILKTAGTGVMAGIAGCGGGDGDGDGGDTTTTTATTTSGDGDGGDGGDGDSGSGEPMEDTFDGNQLGASNPNNIQFNPFNPKNYWSGPAGGAFGSLTIRLQTRDPSWEGILLEDWSFPDNMAPGQTVSITFRDDIEWSNGDPVTARDYLTKLKLGRLVNPNATFPYTKMPEMGDDDRTIQWELKSKVNPTILKVNVLGDTVDVKHDIFEEKLTTLQEALRDEDSDAVSEARADVLEFKLSLEEAVFSGQWQVDSLSDTEAISVRNSGFPDELQPSWPRYRNVAAGEGVRDQRAQEGKIDASQGGSFSCQNYPEEVQCQVRNYFSAYGASWEFAHEHKDTQHLKVRQAFCYLLDRFQADYNARWADTQELNEEQKRSAVRNEVHKQWVDLTDPASEQWYTGEQVNKLRQGRNNYQQDISPEEADQDGPGVVGMPDREYAAKLLRDVGYKKQNDKWMRPDGTRFELTIPAFPDWEPWSVTASGQLQNFGVESGVQIEEASTYFGTTLADGDWGIAINLFACCGSSTMHPFRIHDGDLRQNIAGRQNQNVNIPEEVQVPENIGERTFSESKMQTVNIEERVSELGQATDQDRARELTQLLGWVQNWQLTEFPTRQYTANSVITTDHWTWPERGGPYDMHFTWAEPMEAGKVRAKTE